MPYDYHDPSSVINGNMHTLTLATPIVRDGGTVDYDQLTNKPIINGVELVGSLSLDDLGIQPEGNYPNSPLTEEDIERIINDEI